jgi:large subunit ribosomal protein L21
MNYAIVKTGGKQYRVQPGQSLLVERLRADEGAKVALEPLLVRDGDKLVDGGDAAKATVSAKVVGHERGPKIRVLKFKPKRGYKRRTGHRQELTRLEVTEIKLGGRTGGARKPAAGKSGDKPAAEKPAARKAAEKPAAGKTARKPAASRARTKKEDAEDGS